MIHQSSFGKSKAPHVCDVLVVGGGPAGLTAAIALRQQGMDVIVADALIPPIDKACGEGLMPDSRLELHRLGVDSLPGCEFTGICFASHTPSGCTAVSADFPTGKGIGVRRHDLHQALASHARFVGVRLKWGAHVDLGNPSQVNIGGEACAYKFLVGADGASSRVRRWANLEAGKLQSQRLGFRRHYQVKPWSDRVEVHWGRSGQAYVTPVAENEICVAAITRQRGLHFDDILATIGSLRERLDSNSMIGRPRGAATTTRILQRVTRGNVALVGDASGTVDAITGEGLASAFRQAFLLGSALSREKIAEYEEGHSAILRLPRQMSSLMLLMDRYPLIRRRAMQTLCGSPGIFSRMLRVHVGDEAMAHFAVTQGSALAYRAIFPGRPPLRHSQHSQQSDVVFN